MNSIGLKPGATFEALHPKLPHYPAAGSLVLKSEQLDVLAGNPPTPSPAVAAKATVLIGFAEAIAAPEVAWSLIDDGFDVVAFARRGKASALRHSRHVTCYDICAPEADVHQSLLDLSVLLASLRAAADSAERIIFPLDDTAVWLCSTFQSEKAWRSAGPQGTCVDLALNKQMQTEMAREAGFNVPKTRLVRSADDAFELIRRTSFPLVLKPMECVPVRKGRVQKGKNWVCADSTELKQAVKEWGEKAPLLAQPFIPGTGEGVFGFATPRGIHSWSAHRRVRMMNPQGSGSSACVSQTIDPEIRSRAEDLISKSHWNGLFMIELLRDDAGTPWFVELNGRAWGSMALSRRQGFEYPAWQARLALGQEPRVEREPSSTPGVVCRHVGRELMYLLFVLRGPKSKAFRKWPTFWEALRSVLRLRWADALYNWRRNDPKVFIADIYYTLRDNLIKSRHGALS